jgi:hypothetical protein
MIDTKILNENLNIQKNITEEIENQIENIKRQGVALDELQVKFTNLAMEPFVINDGLETLSVALNDVTIALIELTDELNNNSKSKIFDFVVVIIEVIATIVALASILQTAGVLTGILATAGKIIGGVFAFLAGPVGIIIAVIGALIGVFILLYNKWDAFKEIVDQLWQNHIKPFLGNVLEFVDELINLAKIIYNNVIAPIVGALVEILAPAFETVFKVIGKIIR